MSNGAGVKIVVDAGSQVGTLRRDWRYFGYDECNYTQHPDGEALISKIVRLEETPCYIRTHHLLCTGNCHGAYKWGSTNVYSEDPTGKPVHDWKTIDSILDVILRNGAKPFFEIGFMPMDLADPHYAPNGSDFGDYSAYREIGWACPPKDYSKWYELTRALVVHCVGRYGEEELRSWYWELWNEPDIFYWRAGVAEYCKLYDYTEAALHSVLGDARLGGPATCGPTPGNHGEMFLSAFLEHCARGRNYVTGARGSRLDYVTFHVKGGSFPFSLHAQKETPSVLRLASQVRLGLEIIREQGYGNLEVVLSEADPDGWAAGGRFDNANLNFRNTQYYASFVASSYQKIRDLSSAMNMDVRPLAWAFMFVGERCFEGTRTFVTQGIDKAILSLFKMYARLGATRCSFESSHRYAAEHVPLSWSNESFREVDGLSTVREGGKVQVMIHAHDDDWDSTQPYSVDVELRGLESGRPYRVIDHRVDAQHSNPYAEWIRQGSPDYPNKAQWEAINARAHLEQVESMETTADNDGVLHLNLKLPSHAVSLLEVEPG